MDTDDQIAEKRRIRAEKKAIKDFKRDNGASLIQAQSSVAQKQLYLPRTFKSIPSASQNFIQNDSCNRLSTSIRIMTWNILAQCLVRRTLFPGSDCLKWKDRMPAITREIIELDSDVICLQEVDRLSDHGPVLNQAGYEYTHVIGGYEEDGKQHGLLIGWKRNSFHLIKQDVIRLDEQEHDSRVGLSRVTRNVGLICALAFNNNPSGIIIGTTHLFWHPCFAYERARQTAFLSKALAGFKVDDDCDSQKWPVFLAGDLNEQPGGPAYRLLSGANLSEKQLSVFKESNLVHKSVDTLFGKTTENYTTLEGDEDRVFKDVRPSHSEDGMFEFHELKQIVGPNRWLSLYGYWGNKMTHEDDNRFMNRPGFDPDPRENPIGSGYYEPMWTNFTPLWRCTLDYIWMLCKDDPDLTDSIQVIGLLPTHRTQALEPGLPRLGVEPSDHISLMAEVLISL